VGQHGRVATTERDPGAEVRALADEFWEARLEASPLFATFLGDHRYDDRVDDLAADAERRRRHGAAGGPSTSWWRTHR
jgi:hypothetical protein